MKKNFTPNEFWVLALGVLLILGGVLMFVAPRDAVIPHETRAPKAGRGDSLAAISAGQMQFCGIFGILLGAGMITLAVYRGKK